MLCWTMDGWLFLIYYSSSFFSWASQHNLGPLLQGWEWTIVVEEEVPTLPKLIQTALNAGNSVRKRWHADPCHHNIWHMASCENCFIDVWTEARVLWLQRRAGFWEGGSKFLFPRHRVMKSKEFATFQRPKCHLIGYGAWFYITDADIPHPGQRQWLQRHCQTFGHGSNDPKIRRCAHAICWGFLDARYRWYEKCSKDMVDCQALGIFYIIDLVGVFGQGDVFGLGVSKNPISRKYGCYSRPSLKGS